MTAFAGDTSDRAVRESDMIAAAVTATAAATRAITSVNACA